MKLKRLPDSELELMMIVWEAKEPVTSAYLMERLEGVRDWGLTTVLNFLARLIDRGFLKRERRGRSNLYTALIDEQTYLNCESRSFLERLHQTSIRNLVATLYDSNAITDKDLEELRQFIEENGKEH